MMQASGADYLALRSALSARRARLPSVGRVMILNASKPACGVLVALVRSVLGYDAIVEHEVSLGAALDRIMASKPDLILLDDRLATGKSGAATLALLRACDHHGPVVITIGTGDHKLRRQMLAAGAADVIERDDYNSGRLSEAFIRAFAPDAIAAE